MTQRRNNVFSFVSLSNWTMAMVMSCCLAACAHAGVHVLHEGAPFIGISAVAVSPDGGTLYVGDPFDDKIYAMPAIGGTPVQISDGELGSVVDLEVSAEGTTIFATLALRGLAPSVVSLPAAGGVATILSPFPVRPSGLCVSPDGSNLYVASSQAQSIVRVPSTGGTPVDLFPLPYGSPTDVVVNPSDNTLLFTSDGSTPLYKVAISGGIPIGISVDTNLGEPVSIALTPDESSLYILDTNYDINSIFACSTAGGPLTVAYAGETEFYLNGRFALSPTGESIYFGGWRASNGNYVVLRLDATVAVETAAWGDIKTLYR